LAPNTHGQLAMDVLINPQTTGESARQYNREKDAIIDSLKRRAKLLSEAFNTLPGISCQSIDGAMYAFPSITIPERAVKVAKEQGLAPDLWYVLEVLKHTGVVCVAGSGFGQKDGTYHFRTTFLPQEHEMKEALERFKDFQIKFMNEYQ
jgi:aspartate/methionine/tyrosine aminotransferase